MQDVTYVKKGKKNTQTYFAIWKYVCTQTYGKESARINTKLKVVGGALGHKEGFHYTCYFIVIY